MTLPKTLHLKDDIDRLHVSSKGGWAYAGIEDNVDASIQRLKDYI